MGTELDIIKGLFENSHENVFITDYHFEVLWSRTNGLPENFLEGRPFDSLHKKTSPIESGRYFFTCEETEYACCLTNFRQQEVYVIQFSGSSAVAEYAACPSVAKFLGSYAKDIRDSIESIENNSRLYCSLLTAKNDDMANSCINVINGHCNRLGKASLNLAETASYAVDKYWYNCVDIKKQLENLVKKCEEALQGKVKMTLEADDGLFVKADAERLENCLLSIIVLAGEENSDTQSIDIRAWRNEKAVTVNIFAGGKNLDKPRLLSREPEPGGQEAVDSDLYIINRFCKSHDARFSIARKNKRSGADVYTLAIPYCVPENFELSAPEMPEIEGYSDYSKVKYRNILSAIVDIY